jgi:hypothetical protein
MRWSWRWNGPFCDDPVVAAVLFGHVVDAVVVDAVAVDAVAVDATRLTMTIIATRPVMIDLLRDDDVADQAAGSEQLVGLTILSRRSMVALVVVVVLVCTGNRDCCGNERRWQESQSKRATKESKVVVSVVAGIVGLVVGGAIDVLSPIWTTTMEKAMEALSSCSIEEGVVMMKEKEEKKEKKRHSSTLCWSG